MKLKKWGQEETAGTSKFRVGCFRSLMEMKVNICINGNMLFLYCACSEVITQNKAISWNK